MRPNGENEDDFTPEALLRNFHSQRNEDEEDRIANSIYDLPALLQTNFTSQLLSFGRLHIQGNASVRASPLQLCADEVIIEGKIDVHGSGCQGGTGRGSPSNVDRCGNAGASYGGQGGAGAPLDPTDPGMQEECKKAIRPIYGEYGHIRYEGSGGGGMKGGAGGGLVYVNAAKMIDITGTINARGKGAELSGHDGVSDLEENGGGGSGGGIELMAPAFSGNGSIFADGGSGALNGGGGAGGRVKV